MSHWQMKSHCPECGAAVIDSYNKGCCPSCGKVRGPRIDTAMGYAYWPVAPHRRVWAVVQVEVGAEVRQIRERVRRWVMTSD